MKERLNPNPTGKNKKPWKIGCSVVALGIMLWILIRGRIWEQTDFHIICRILSDSFFVTGALFFGLWIIWAAMVYGPLAAWGYGYRSSSDRKGRRRLKESGFEEAETPVEQMGYLEYQERTRRKTDLHIEMLVIGIIGIVIGACFSMMFSIFG